MKKYSYLLPMTIMATVANVYGANRGSDRPNVVFIYADDIGYGDLSCNGATTIHTPHVERLAANGIRLPMRMLQQLPVRLLAMPC